MRFGGSEKTDTVRRYYESYCRRGAELPLKTPEGQDTRPTTDRIKETLFNILQGDIPGSIFVDLCSGSGSIGIEAISRGAKRAYFAENAVKAAKCIQDNLSFTKFTDRAVLLKQDVVSALGGIHEKKWT